MLYICTRVKEVIYTANFKKERHSETTAKIKMENLKIEIGFTITRTNQKGLMEWLTKEGWRSESKIKELELEKLTFNRIDGTKEVNKWKLDCRIPLIKKSIILNYA